MGLYNFQSRFVPFILDGRKMHTIRARRARSDKPGSILHLYTGLRTKKAKLLLRVTCTRVEEIEILNGIFGDENHASVTIDGQTLDRSEREMLAQRDGFSNFEDMIAFWNGRLPFRGHIIHWKFQDLKES